MCVSFGHCITFQILKSGGTPLLILLYVAVTTENSVLLRFDFNVGNAVQFNVETADYLELVVCIVSETDVDLICPSPLPRQFKNTSAHPCEFAAGFQGALVHTQLGHQSTR